ncbi:GspH/FimT family protein [Picosynechococcus sp. PCC 7003]|uniref:GspH/FimT family pseudopilin n=1 Tax=Picosynechococcus sp. PCC 7003 TaxID=374981 RepID=UPI000A8CD1FD|nr:GspH/FimT family protein [Picosynechococcus sp. PCC 7003]
MSLLFSRAKAPFRPLKTQGFTLFEVLGVLLLVGILAGIATPSLLGFLARAGARQDFTALQGLLQRTQQEAIRQSRTCRVILPANNSENAKVSSDCRVTEDVVLENVVIKYNNANSKAINFNYRGNTSPLRTIVLADTQSQYQRCLIISNGIGVIRKGVYVGDISGNVSASSCQTTG